MGRRFGVVCRALVLPAAALLLVACPKDKKNNGTNCESDDECGSGFCYLTCLDPEGDADGDGLINSLEETIQTASDQADTDGDGVDDSGEVGQDRTNPADTDGDGVIDALESAKDDVDGDCISDQLDAVTDTHEALVAAHCTALGVCGDADPADVELECPQGLASSAPTCDFAKVAGFSSVDDACDGVDANCDGATDEAFVGVACDVTNAFGTCPGTQVCAAGVVSCGGTEPAGEVCDGVDQDCNGETDEATCDDADPCTTDACLGTDGCENVAKDCDDGDACTTDGCDAATGDCTHEAVVCDDGDACTTDSCDSESGCVAAPVVCDDQNACTTDSCDTVTGCETTPLVCDDGDACTTDSCDSESGCVAAPVVCDDQNACTTDSCDSQAGCVAAAVSCDDGDACTTDSCDTVVGCETAAVVCDDQNACTTDSCDSESGCVAAPVSCDDGDACTTDSCDTQTGCEAAPVVCDDQNACTTDSCDTETGCEAVPVSCDDGDACTTDSCDTQTGCETAPVNCDDQNACTTDSCDSETGCVTAPVSCDDNDVCTTDSCDTQTGCEAVPVDCDDGDACTTDSCDSETGCVTAPVSCDDGDACTTDSCDSESGCETAPVSCDDGDACTTDSCDSETGCETAPLNCDDGDACTTDSCNTETGCETEPVVCADDDACTTDSCNTETGCETAPLNCDDGDACTTDSCNTETGCETEPVVCDDGDACTTDSCDSAEGCVFTDLDCSDGEPCTDDLCDPLDGCFTVPTNCDDGDICNGAEACAEGEGCYSIDDSVVIVEDFETEAPGWTTVSFSEGAVNLWQIADATGGSLPVFFDSLAFGTPNNGSSGFEQSALVSPSFDLTNGGVITFRSFVSNENASAGIDGGGEGGSDVESSLDEILPAGEIIGGPGDGQPPVLVPGEFSENGYDRESLEVSYDDGETWTTLIGIGDLRWRVQKEWVDFEVRVAAGTATETTRFRFVYDTFDGCCGDDEVIGWFIDDFTVSTSDALICDDSNACNTDACDPTLGCVHEDLGESPCDDGDVCTQDICVSYLGCFNESLASQCDIGTSCLAGVCDAVLGCTFVFESTATTDPLDSAGGWTTGVLEVGAPNNWAIGTSLGGTVPLALDSSAWVNTNGFANLGLENSYIQSPIFSTRGGARISFFSVIETAEFVFDEEANAPLGDLLVVELSFDGGATWEEWGIDGEGGLPSSGSGTFNLYVSGGDGSAQTMVRFIYTAFGPPAGEVEVQGWSVDDFTVESPFVEEPCDDGLSCTTDACVPYEGCSFESTCDDLDLCTDDQCTDEGCLFEPTNCDDGTFCTLDSCDPATGCGNVPVDCDDDNTCSVDACDPETGACHYATQCEESPCGDGFCGGDESCTTCPVDCGNCVADCCIADGGTGCANPELESCVCELDSWCCETEWDDLCVERVADCGLTCETQCGDGTCDLLGAENCGNCPSDCGVCDPCTIMECDGGTACIFSPNPDCYDLTSFTTDWVSARNYCSESGGYLVSIRNATENEFVRQLALSECETNNFFIGLSDELVEGEFVWADGSPLNYTNWSPGEPSDTEGEDYVEMWQQGQWNDHGPDVQKSCVVCEFDQPQLFTPAGF
jgi:hypothetical protein